MGTTFSFDRISAFASPIRRKRKRESDDDLNNSNVGDLQTPKRKRSKSTSKYIYQTLFLDGEGSDITIVALGKEWHLHKVYLCQCAYFSSMFSGSWTESSLKTIDVSIPDDTIDENALKITFGSLYTDTVFIKPVNVTRVLAAANLFQLEGLIQQCALMMKEKISGVTVCTYYTAALTYGQEEVKQLCMAWLEDNLLTSQSADLLREINIDLMTALIASHRLFVVQVEMNIYAMLKKWMFLQLNCDWTGDLHDLEAACGLFYANITDGTSHFLEQSAGVQFIRVFAAVRWQHVICDITSIRIVQQDRILPIDWLRPVIQYQWLNMLQVDQGFDSGPASEVSEDVFDDLCVRCGRVLEHEGQFCWRWTGYNFGFDLVISYTNSLLVLIRLDLCSVGSAPQVPADKKKEVHKKCVQPGRIVATNSEFSVPPTSRVAKKPLQRKRVRSERARFIGVKRNTAKDSCPNAVSLQDLRNLYYRLTVRCFDSCGQTKYMQTTGLKHTSLTKDEDQVIMICRSEITFPLCLNLNLMFVTPVPDQDPPKLCLTKPAMCTVNTRDFGLQVDPPDLNTDTRASNCLLSRIRPSPNTSPVKLSRETQTVATETIHWSSGTLQSPPLMGPCVTVARAKKSQLNTLAESCLNTLGKLGEQKSEGKSGARSLRLLRRNTLNESIGKEVWYSSDNSANAGEVEGSRSQLESTSIYDSSPNTPSASLSESALDKSTRSLSDTPRVLASASCGNTMRSHDLARRVDSKSLYNTARADHSGLSLSVSNRDGSEETLRHAEIAN